MSRLSRLGILTVAISASGLLATGSAADQQTGRPLCIYISSYHNGYAWSDGVEQGLRDGLDSHCEIVRYDMDTKRNKSEEYIRQAAHNAYMLIEKSSPDIVIASDDNAAKYLIKPYLRDSEIPVVFAGINWTVEEYEFPYSNTTGMVEIAPLGPLLEKGQELTRLEATAIYLGAATITEQKNFQRFVQEADRRGISIEPRLVESTQEWIEAFTEAQSGDFIITGSDSGIADWNSQLIAEAVLAHGKVPSLTNHEWMMPYTLLGFTKIPQEQGEWAAESAIAILNGKRPDEIPLVVNRRWDMWVNDDLAEKFNIGQDSVFRRAKRVRVPTSVAEIQ